jgi:hypothetical protein
MMILEVHWNCHESTFNPVMTASHPKETKKQAPPVKISCQETQVHRLGFRAGTIIHKYL